MSEDYLDILKKGTVKIKGKRLGVISFLSVITTVDSQPD